MIYKIDTWQKTNNEGNVVQEVYCLSDMHAYEGVRPEQLIDFNNTEQNQRTTFINALKHIQKNKALFIVEDPYSVNTHTHQKIAAYLPLLKPAYFAEPEGKRPPFLLFLDEILQSHNLSVFNAECRQQRIISHLFLSTLVALRQSRSPILKPFSVNIKKLYGPTLCDIGHEFITVLNTVKEYQKTDGPILAEYYAGIITKLEQTQPFIDLLLQASPSLFYWDICDAANATILQEFYSAFLLWGLELVDAYALHALYTAGNKEKVYIIMGGIHTHNVQLMLPKLGYTKVETIGIDPLTEQEYADLATIRAALFDISQFVPSRPITWLESQKKRIRSLWSNNILANTINKEAQKVDAHKKLNEKLAYVEPIDAFSFKMLSTEKE